MGETASTESISDVPTADAAPVPIGIQLSITHAVTLSLNTVSNAEQPHSSLRHEQQQHER